VGERKTKKKVEEKRKEEKERENKKTYNYTLGFGFYVGYWAKLNKCNSLKLHLNTPFQKWQIT